MGPSVGQDRLARAGAPSGRTARASTTARSQRGMVRVLQRDKDFPTRPRTTKSRTRAGRRPLGFRPALRRRGRLAAMDVRAFKGDVAPGLDPAQIDEKLTLPLLRLERLSPQRPHRAVPRDTDSWCGAKSPTTAFSSGSRSMIEGVSSFRCGTPPGNWCCCWMLRRRRSTCSMRTGGRRVVAVSQLRKDIIAKAQELSGSGTPALPAQTGAAGFAISGSIRRGASGSKGREGGAPSTASFRRHDCRSPGV